MLCIYTRAVPGTTTSHLLCSRTPLWCRNACFLMCYAPTSHNTVWWSGITSSHVSPSPVCTSLVTCQLCASTTVWQHGLACSHPRCVPGNLEWSALKTHIQVTLYGLNRLCLVIHMYEHICIYMHTLLISNKKAMDLNESRVGHMGKFGRFGRRKRGKYC